MSWLITLYVPPPSISRHKERIVLTDRSSSHLDGHSMLMVNMRSEVTESVISD